MTILALAQEISKALQITPPTLNLLSSTDNNMILIVSLLNEEVPKLRDEYPWPELQFEYTFTLSTNVASYALAPDFSRFQNETLWNRTQKWPLIGPIDAYVWQQYKSGLVTTLPRQRFRVKGWSSTQFFVDPTPTASENGQTAVFEYITDTVFRPATWIASTDWVGYTYCSYNGYIFDRGSTGSAVTGTSPPTPSSLNDGNITWTLVTAPYNAIVYETDEVILNNNMVKDRVVWRFKEERGLDFGRQRDDAENRKDVLKTALSAAGVITINGWRLDAPMIGPWSYPEANYGI